MANLLTIWKLTTVADILVAFVLIIWSLLQEGKIAPGVEFISGAFVDTVLRDTNLQKRIRSFKAMEHAIVGRATVSVFGHGGRNGKMFDHELFVREMARRGALDEKNRAREQLWSLNHDVLNVIQPPNQPLVSLPNDTVEINAVYADGFPLGRTRDVLLDAGDPEWRSAESDILTSYIWHGEEGRYIRLHPVPAFEQELWIICQRVPMQFYPKWFNLIIALHTVEQLTMSDQVIGRQQMAQYCQAWKEVIYASTAKELQIQQRRGQGL